MENQILEVDSVRKSFKEKSIITDIYLKCEIGDIVGVFGRNGSGKSTLLKIIYGILEAENKFIRINNEVLNHSYLIKNGLAYLPQDNFIPINLTVRKLIKLFVSDENLSEFYNDELINKVVNNKIHQLSGGELKYLQVKIILNTDAYFCLLDEPYTGLSPIMIEEINQLILSKSKTKGIIITDHNYRDVLKIATKIYLLKDGYGRLLNTKEELIEQGYLNEGML